MVSFRVRCVMVAMVLLGIIAVADNVRATPIEALGFSGGGPYNPPGGYTVGWTFTVNAPVSVTDLGWYSTGDSQSHDVGIFDSTGALLTSNTVVDTDPLSVSGFRYHAIAAPTYLGAGSYTIGGVNVGDSSGGFYGNTAAVTAPWQITYGAGVYAPGSTLTQPTSPSDQNVSYFGPNFQFNAYNSAPQISVNLATNGLPAPTGTAVGSLTAGVVSAGHWNDLPTSAVTNLVLNDSAGTQTGLKISVPATSVSDAGAGVNFGAGQEGDTAMVRGHNYTAGGTPLDLTFTGKIPYSYFDVYAYYNSGAIDNTQAFSILKSDGASLGLSRTGSELAGGDTGFVASNSDGTNNANYVKFASLSSLDIPADFILRAQGVASTAGGGPYAYLNGLQIVEHARPVISLKFGADVETADPAYGTTAVGANKAGLIAVSHWNDMATGSVRTNIPLMDSNGYVVDNLTFSTSEPFTCPGSAYSAVLGNNAPNFAVDAAGNNALMNGYPYHASGTPIDLTFNGKIPYSMFDMLVYFNAGGQEGNTMTFSLLDSDGNALLEPLTRTGKEGASPVSEFVLSDGVNGGNYVLFAGLTKDSLPENFILRVSGGSAYNYINGLQIVQIPEPGSLLLLLIAGLGLTVHVRRRHK